MVFHFFEWNKETWKGIFLGLEILLFLLAISGFFVDLKIGQKIGEYPVLSNSSLLLGETKNFQEDIVAAYTLHTGYFTQSCLNDVNIKSAVPSVGDINGGVFCRGQKITVDNWIIEIKDIRPEKNEAVLVKTKLHSIPLWLIWVIFLLLAGVHMLISKCFFKRTKLSLFFDKEDTFDKLPVLDLDNKEGQFIHLAVKNEENTPAKNCYGELISISRKKRERFEAVKEYRSKMRLRWANQNNGFQSINIDADDKKRLDLFFVMKDDKKIYFETDNFVPRGIQTVFKFGTYKAKIRLSGDNVKSVEKEFIIRVQNYDTIKVEE